MNALVSTSGGTGMAQPRSSARMVGKLGLSAAALGMAAFGAGVLASNGVAPATVIPVANYNFASPPVTSYNSLGNGAAVTPGADTAITDWGIAKASGSYTGVGVEPVGGGQVAYDESVANAVIYQDVGALAPDTTYTLSVQSGSSYASGGTAEIMLVNTAADSNTLTQAATGTTLNSTSYTVGGSLVPVTVSYTTGASVSGDLSIELALTGAHPSSSPKNTQVQWSDASLTAVPEPASLGLLAIGGLGLLLLKRRRMT